jgi:hypothetical protein
LGFVDIVAFGAGVADDPDDEGAVLGAAVASFIGAGVDGIVVMGGGVGAVIGAVDGGAVWAAANAGATASTAAASRDVNCVFVIVRLTW